MVLSGDGNRTKLRESVPDTVLPLLKESGTASPMLK